MKQRNVGRWQAAFTLVELMIVVAIIGVLASVAIPAFMKYIRRSKSVEAVNNVERIYTGGRAYFVDLDGTASVSGVPMTPQFPDTEPMTPAGDCCGQPGDKCVPVVAAWETGTWNGVRFSMTESHYYRYEFESTGTGAPGPGSAFTARALGDLDCDGVFSTYSMNARYTSTATGITGASGMYKANDIE